MPNFVGGQLAEAKEKVARAGLQIASITRATAAQPVTPENTASATLSDSLLPAPETQRAESAPSIQNGKIVRQSPPAGSRVTPETQIKFQIAQ
jgi:beta-lactam-binding protein with PASTA domain